MTSGRREYTDFIPQNTYLIGINVTNKLKEKHYHEYVPELLDVGFPSKLSHYYAYCCPIEFARSQ
jgi:hypothetical protein